MNLNQLFWLSIVVLSPTFLTAQCLNGTYTFGGNNPDFNSFFQLEQRLIQDGICGPVEVLIRTGTYAEDFQMSNLQGTSAINSLTIRSESGNPADVVLNAPVNNTNAGVFILNFVHHVRLEDLTFRPSENSGTYGVAINIRNRSSNISLENLVLQGPSQGDFANANYALVSCSSVQDLRIEDCSFSNSQYGLYGLTQFVDNENWTIRNNTLSQTRIGIQIQNIKNLLLEGNTYTEDFDLTQYGTGFILQGLNITAASNSITAARGGINVQISTGAIRLINNMVSIFPVENDQFVSGITVSGADSVAMDYNSIRIADYNTPVASSAVQLNATDQLFMRNNIILNGANQGFACRFDAFTATSLSDHNIFYAADEAIQFSFSQLYSLQDWQNTFNQDLNSREVLPVFVASDDLHLDADASINQFVSGTATPIAGITTDIDGEVRSAQTPDIGADEFSSAIAGVDVAILGSNMRGEQCDGIYPIELAIQNNSSEPIVYLELNWTINEKPEHSLTFIGSLAASLDTIFVLDSIYLEQEATYNFSFQLKLPNGGADANTSNNTLSTNFTVLSKPQPKIVPPTELCPNDSPILTVESSYTGYLWSTGAATSNIAASKGIYELTVTDANGCSGNSGIWLPENDLAIEEAWMTNGYIEDMEVWEDEIFLGGSFEVVTPYQPRLGAIDRNTGAYQAFPRIQEGITVHSIISDGNGGYFIGGDFSVIGKKPRKNVAHINTDGEVSSWRGDANGAVQALFLQGNQLFVGGAFTNIGGRPRNGIAALSPTYGHTLDWEASVFQADASVYALSTYEDYLVVGGKFAYTDPVFGSNNLFLINLEDGSFPNVNNTLRTFNLPTILDIEVQENRLYLGAQEGFHWLDINTGQSLQIGSVIGSNPVELSRNGDKLYACISYGCFEYDMSSQDFTGWEIQSFNSTITSSNVHNGQLFLGGNFSEQVQDMDHEALQVYDLSTQSRVPLTTYGLHSGYTPVDIDAIFADDDVVILGGNFEGIGGMIRNNLFSIDGQSYLPTDWNPNPNGRVRTIHTDLEHLYVGGTFSEIADSARTRVAAFDQDGQLTPWNSDLTNGDIFVLATSDTLVYVGGAFGGLGGGYRNLAAFSKETGAIHRSFRPQPDDYVSSLVVIDSVVMASGRFEILYDFTDTLYFFGGFGVAVLDANDASLIRGYPLRSQFINDMKFYNGLAYIGGRFTNISNNPRQRIAAITPDTFPFVAWSQAIDDEIYSIALGYGTAFAQGDFQTINGASSRELGAMDLSQSNTSYDWVSDTPFDFTYTNDMELYNKNLWVSGQFTRVFDQDRSYLAAIGLGCLSEDIDFLVAPDAEFEFLVADSTRLEVAFQNNSAAASRFRWDFGDGQSSTAINPVHAFAQTGTYEVCLTADHSTGQSTICQSVLLGPVSTISPVVAENWTLYPNPAVDRIHLSVADRNAASQIWDIHVYNTAGRLVHRAALSSGENTRMLALPKGLANSSYHVEVHINRQRYWGTSFIKH